MQPTVSVIIPSFNAGAKVVNCLESLRKLRQFVEIEAIFIDDCSTDATFERITDFVSSHDWALVRRLESNSGSPSVPRNVGLELASGEYVIFLDADDQILPAGVLAALDLAGATRADLIRAPLIRVDGERSTKMNSIKGWGELRTRLAKVKSIVRFHSTTPTALYSREFLISNDLQWPVDLHMAEDAVFLYRALALGKPEYSEEPIYVYDATPSPGQTSITQRYGDEEMENHIRAWSESQAILQRMHIDFFDIRGQAALQAVFESLIQNNREGISRQVFRRFGDLLRSHSSVARYDYSPRYAELRDFILKDRFEDFLHAIKPRMVIAGYDLKFVLPALSQFDHYYQVRVDEWVSHFEHNERQSLELLEWADVIFCEWVLGNAVWYSANKRPDQAMVVRVHRFELTRPYGFDVDIDAVDRFLVIAPALMDEVQLAWDVPRDKIAYAPNFIPIEDYKCGGDPDRVYRIGMVGFVPKLKGLHRALDLLKQLRSHDSRYVLYLYGRKPQDLPWVLNDPEEQRYFEQCARFVRENKLDKAIYYEGWVKTEEALADLGFVLSLSDIEGSHVAASEGFAAGGVTLLRNWPGSEFMYPDEFIFDDVEEMVKTILRCREVNEYKSLKFVGRDAVEKLYGKKRFREMLVKTIPSPRQLSRR